MYDIEEIGDKILGVLASLKANNRLKTLENYQGSLEDALENPEQLIMLFPAVLVVFSGSTYNDSYEDYIQRISFDIIIATGSLRGEKQRRVGAYQLLDDVREILVGNQLGLQIPPLSIVREEPLLVGKVKGRFIAAYVATYSF